MLLDTPICDFGWKAPSFTLSSPDGTHYKMEDMMGEKGLLIAFICNHCPYVHAIIDRFVADAKLLQHKKINIIAIMSNDYQEYPEDSPENMQKFAIKHNFTFPYLVDKTQEVGKAYKAVCTPDFFGFNKDYALHYRGRLDNIKTGHANDRVPELLQAMEEIALTNQGPQKQNASMGCSIKWR